MPHRPKPQRLRVEALENRLTPAGTQIPAGEFNWTQYAPDGTLGQLIWDGQTLVYRTRDGGGWHAESIASSRDFTRAEYNSTDEIQAASQTAQLVYTPDGAAHALFLEKRYDSAAGAYQTLIRHYVRSAGGWGLAETVAPPWQTGRGPSNLVAEAGPDGSLHLIFAETTSPGTGPGHQGAGALWYATNASGVWAFDRIADTADLRYDVWFAGGRWTPRFLSLAVDGQNRAHVTYTPQFSISGAFGTVHSDLMYATNAGGAWRSEAVVRSLDGTADAGLGASVAVAPGGVVGVASYYVDRYDTGSPERSWLMYHTRNPGGGWTTTTAVDSPDGYVAGDGPRFTGFAPQLSYDAAGRPTVVFSDEAGEHLPVSSANEFAGQIRSATLVNGSWVTTTIFRQSDPLVNQLFYPVAATYGGETIYAGVVATSTLDGNRNPVRVDVALLDVATGTPTAPPPAEAPAPVPELPPGPPVAEAPAPATEPELPPPAPPEPTPEPPVAEAPPEIPPPVVQEPLPEPQPVEPPGSETPPAAEQPPVEPTPAEPPAPEAPPEIPPTPESPPAGEWWTPSGLSGGATIARGDVNRDGIDDVIVGSGRGQPGRVEVYSGETRERIAAYAVFPSATGGLVVAAGDVTGDGRADIVVGAATGSGQVVVLDGATGGLVREFPAFGAGYAGGVRLGVGDVNRDGRADVVAAAAVGGRPVRVFDGASVASRSGVPSLLGTLPAFAQHPRGPLTIAVGDVVGDGYADIVVGTDRARLQVFGGAGVGRSGARPLASATVWAAGRVGQMTFADDADGDGLPDLLVASVNGARTARLLTTRLNAGGWVPAADGLGGVYVG